MKDITFGEPVHVAAQPRERTDMEFQVTLYGGGSPVAEPIRHTTTRNNFTAAAQIAVGYLFVSKEADNVACVVVRDGRPDADFFFYAEKG
jgi:hypothetical protein